MRLRVALLFIGVLGFALVAPRATLAQAPGGTDELTVDDLVARALADNPDLRAARAEVDAARGRLRQAGLRPNPMLDLAGQQNVAGPDNNVMVGVTLPLDLNGRKEGRVGVAERELEMKHAQVAERERRLRADVRMKAGELLAARRNLRFTEELLKVNQDALGLIRERVRQGAIPPLEESLLLVEVNRLETTRRILESRLEVLGLQLRALAGLAPDVPLSVRGDLGVTARIVDRREGLTRALATRPDLAVAGAEAAMARAKILKEKAEGRWDASVNVGYQRMDSGFGVMGVTERGGTRPIQDIFHYVGGGVTITLPLRNRNEGNVAAAVAETQAAERRLEFTTLTIRQEVAAAFTLHEVAQRAVEIFGRGVREVARQNLEVVRKTYELGRIPLLDVIAEQRRYIEIETGYTETLKQVYDAVVEIERAVGTVDR
jgi:cobalt-zinc-cadmium efflux system outer membrane protein